jgi:hypothetical protein
MGEKITKETVFPKRMDKEEYVNHIKRVDRQDVLSQVDFSNADLIKVENNIYDDRVIPEILVSRTEVKVMKLDKVKWELVEMKSKGMLDDYPELGKIYKILKEEL